MTAIGIIMGSNSDWPVMEHAARILEQFGVPYEARVVSAHRTPDLMFDYAKSARERGLQAIIAGAGGAAHLPGDFALADDHGLQSRRSRKQIDEAVATPQVPQLHVLALSVRGLGELALHRVLQCVGVGRGRGVDVDSDPIAGTQDHDSARVRHRAREGRTQIVRAGEPGDVIEGGVAVVRGEHMNSHNASI